MKILVTGAAGFIGYHVTNRMLENGHAVVGIDNICNNKDLELKYARMNLLGITASEVEPLKELVGKNGFRFIMMDVLDRDSVDALCKKESFDIIIHLAAMTGSATANMKPARFYETNVTGTMNMLETARLYGVQHFFFSSSSTVYSAQASSPLQEDDHVDTPLNMYAASKRSAELLCYTYAKSYGMPISIFRLFSVYGPWCRPDSVPMQMADRIMKGRRVRIMNNGHMVRDFTYIDDLLEGMDAALASQPYAANGVPYALYNVGRGKPVSLVAFTQAMEHSLGRTTEVQMDPTSPLVVGELVEMYADNSKLERELAYSPVWDYEEALPRFADWFLEHYGKTFHM
ncbi:MAG: NAD-dependent epimerase/dehydratase family protein [Akkermansia sp.]|nr:NAD-dependent epimerase/dehydratase family protein [Akkermansia sp.]